MRIGIMTGRGDAPGLNGIIEAAATTLLHHKAQVIGIEDDFDGFFLGRTHELTWIEIQGSQQIAGTLLTFHTCLPEIMKFHLKFD